MLFSPDISTEMIREMYRMKDPMRLELAFHYLVVHPTNRLGGL